jgi:hypothetical protein
VNLREIVEKFFAPFSKFDERSNKVGKKSDKMLGPVLAKSCGAASAAF